MLEKDRFLAVKKLARDIRDDNDKIFKSFDKMSFDKAVSEKEKFINSVINNMDIAFNEGEEGREEKQIFRANLLIPNDNDFYETYSSDKNIRNLMNKYKINIEDIMSKITELNVYNKYIDESINDDKTDSEISFVSEMVKMSPKEAENLLDEIDNLSSVMEDLDLSKKEKPELLKPEVVEVDKEEFDDSFDDITSAVSNFVDNYDDMLGQLEKQNDKINSLQTQIEKLESVNAEYESIKEENNTLRKENEKLVSQNKKMEIKLAKSAEILNKIYKSISKK